MTLLHMCLHNQQYAIFTGASPGVHMWLKMLIRNQNDCVLTPIPQYPLYSACLTLYGGTLLPYYLDESRNWSLSIPELRQQVDTVRLDALTGCIDWHTVTRCLGFVPSVCGSNTMSLC